MSKSRRREKVFLQTVGEIDFYYTKYNNRSFQVTATNKLSGKETTISFEESIEEVTKVVHNFSTKGFSLGGITLKVK
ncbi:MULTISPECIES: hypothetical protein [Bacillati]|uniref:hypothetical protein n=1 Tax=Bacillati TaxID=1783272 RepID=UPI00114036E9|nr:MULTISPECIES: hypothetical protein [Terrabacteria group]MED3677058.1 hypothetical protein [Bacillus velezensis]